MDFLKKAKAQLAEVQNDLNKGLENMGIGDKKSETGPAESSSSTPADTPATSVAPSTAGAPKAKLPLAVRKNVRDVWETAQPDIEKKISTLLGVPWKTDIDVAYIYGFAEEGYAKSSTGDMIKSYFEGALYRLERFVDNYGDEGVSELNRLASSHTISMNITEKPGINYTACEITSGVLRILFVKGYLGTNVSDSLDTLSEAINEAGKSGDSDSSMDFNARSGIKSDYEPKIGAVKTKFEKILELPTFEIEPNFEANYAAIVTFIQNTKKGKDIVRSDWQKTLGRFTLDYFSDFVDTMESKEFGDDEMLQEGFKDAVEKNQIALRVVEKLKEGSNYNECVIENGVLYIRTTPENWAVNVRDPAHGLMDIL